MKNLLIILILPIGLVSCSTNAEIMKPYVIELVTFKYKNTIQADDFWAEEPK